MRIILTIDDASFVGGVQSSFLLTVEMYHKLGHHVRIVAGLPTYQKTDATISKLQKIVGEENIVQLPYSGRHIMGVNVPLFWSVVKSNQLRQWLQSGCDVLYFENYQIPLFIFLLFRPTIETIVRFSGVLFLEESSSLSAIFRPRIVCFRLMQFLIMYFSKTVIVRSEYAQIQSSRYFAVNENKIMLIAGAVDTTLFKPPTISKSALRLSLGLPPDRKILLYLARIEPRKGLCELLSALAILKSKKIPVSLLVVFPPAVHAEYFEVCNRLIRDEALSDMVIYRTGVANENTPQYYQACDCFVSSSLDLETFGMTTIEAMACGTPVLAAKAGSSIEEILGEVAPEMVLDYPDPQDLATKIEWILNVPPAKMSKIKRNLRQSVLTNYSKKMYSAKLTQLLDRVSKKERLRDMSVPH